MSLRPATADDIDALGRGALAYRTRAIAGVDEQGRVLGVGGLVYRPDGIWAAVLIADEGRRCKIALVKAARRVLAEAAAAGVKVIYASAEPGRAGAHELLDRLGFKPDGGRYVWRAA